MRFISSHFLLDTALSDLLLVAGCVISHDAGNTISTFEPTFMCMFFNLLRSPLTNKKSGKIVLISILQELNNTFLVDEFKTVVINACKSNMGPLMDVIITSLASTLKSKVTFLKDSKAKIGL